MQSPGLPRVAIIATVAGEGHAVAVVAANYQPGVYIWIGYAEGISTGTRYTIARGVLNICRAHLRSSPSLTQAECLQWRAGYSSISV